MTSFAQLGTTIDLEADTLEPVSRLATGRLGSRPSPAVIWRWCTRGVTVQGRKVRLEAVKIGGQWRSTAKAFAAFLVAQTTGRIMQEPSAVDAEPELSASLQRRLAAAGLA